MLDISLKWEKSLNQDFEEIIEKKDKAVTAGLKIVLSDFVTSLQSHVQEDVYNAYAPKKYVRTNEMINPENMQGSVKENVLSFNYEFSTEMTNANHGNYYENSDDVIRAIQDGKNYPWGVKIEPRLFWDKFVSEQLIGGQAEKSLVNGMNLHDKTLKVISTKNSAIIEGNDSFGELHGTPQGGMLFKK